MSFSSGAVPVSPSAVKQERADHEDDNDNGDNNNNDNGEEKENNKEQPTRTLSSSSSSANDQPDSQQGLFLKKGERCYANPSPVEIHPKQLLRVHVKYAEFHACRCCCCG